jgi:hypothetical protein
VAGPQETPVEGKDCSLEDRRLADTVGTDQDVQPRAEDHIEVSARPQIA